MSGEAYLEAAVRLGRDVAAAAIWSGERCSWVGGMPDEGPGGEIAMTYAGFGPELYGGTAGVGLVLAELAVAAEGAELRQTALGALEQALERAGEVPPSSRLGAYGGQLGIALAAAQAGSILGEPRLTERAGGIVAGLDYRTEPLENDLIAGRGGGILALLALRVSGVEAATLERARELGEDLLAAADRGQAGWSWPSPSYPRQRNLTGLSHGAAGIGLALLELARATGETEFGEGAEAAFAYERALFDPRARNWPDLRQLAAGRPGEAAPSCATLWCHGAPGIALARLRACELGHRNGCEEEARIALETTVASIRTQIEGGNYSLCHGLAGNAEVVREAESLLGHDAIAIARSVGDAGIERYLESGQPWPLGVYEGQTDSLMLGRAGTSYFYLRLHDPGRPSLLLLRPESFA